MKTLAKRNRAIFRWIMIAVICYLLASAGVNRVINPYYYFHTGHGSELPVSSDDEYVMIDLSAHADAEGFLTIAVEEMNTFSISVKARLIYETGETEEKTIDIGEVINCYKLQSWGEGIVQIAIPKNALKDAELQIGSAEWSQKRQVNTVQMLQVFISFLCLVIFYSFVQEIRKKYAK